MIENSVIYIENNLTTSLKRKDIAGKFGMSIYHFHRIFKSFVGESTGDYLGKRRLTEAAHQLLTTEHKILDIALQYNYGSQEAFSRAFKSRFGVTPGEYRGIGKPITMERPRITKDTLRYLQEGLTLEPKIIEQREISVVGLENACIAPPNDNQLLTLWNHSIPRLNEIAHKTEPPMFVGIHEFLPGINRFCDTEYRYIVSVSADARSPLPLGMVALTIPACKYVVFTHNKSLLPRLEADRYIHGTWLPNSGYQQSEMNFVLDLKHDLAQPTYDILVPIC